MNTPPLKITPKDQKYIRETWEYTIDLAKRVGEHLDPEERLLRAQRCERVDQGCGMTEARARLLTCLARCHGVRPGRLWGYREGPTYLITLGWYFTEMAPQRGIQRRWDMLWDRANKVAMWLEREQRMAVQREQESESDEQAEP